MFCQMFQLAGCHIMHLLPGNGCVTTAFQMQIMYLLPTDKKPFLTTIQNTHMQDACSGDKTIQRNGGMEEIA